MHQQTQTGTHLDRTTTFSMPAEETCSITLPVDGAGTQKVMVLTASPPFPLSSLCTVINSKLIWK